MNYISSSESDESINLDNQVREAQQFVSIIIFKAKFYEWYINIIGARRFTISYPTHVNKHKSHFPSMDLNIHMPDDSGWCLNEGIFSLTLSEWEKNWNGKQNKAMERFTYQQRSNVIYELDVLMSEIKNKDDYLKNHSRVSKLESQLFHIQKVIEFMQGCELKRYRLNISREACQLYLLKLNFYQKGKKEYLGMNLTGLIMTYIK